MEEAVELHPDEAFEPSLLVLLSEEGPIGALVAVLCIVSTLWLVISRLRGCFRVQRAHRGRDLALLFTAPVSGFLLSVAKIVDAFLNSDSIRFALGHGLKWNFAIRELAMLCFLVGIVAFMLPAKAAAA
jgi:hypothetical protein